MNKHGSPYSSIREALPGDGLALQHPYIAVEKDTSKKEGSLATGLLADQRK